MGFHGVEDAAAHLESALATDVHLDPIDRAAADQIHVGLFAGLVLA